jgi:Phosphotransferase enzyme family
MTFLLGTQNVCTYLIDRGLCDRSDRELMRIEPKICKNFNLLVTLSDRRQLLLKQEPHDLEGKTSGDLLNEWHIHEWLREFPELSHIRPIVSEAIGFDRDSSIIIFNYLNHYSDLSDFYKAEQEFSAAIASSIGISLATIHSITLDRQNYREFLAQNRQNITKHSNFLSGLARITPEKFATVSTDGFKFFELYQRYENLELAIDELNNSFQPCCLTHNDLKLNNILLHNNWVQIAERFSLTNQSKNGRSNDRLLVRIIDWEKWSWGDPAFDLGTLISSYLAIWLNSLVINQNIDIAAALSIAQTPLETLQPSIAALTRSYLAEFPAILNCHPNFLLRVVQFTGLALIERIRAKIYYHEPFGNTGICMLEVAKTLLCDPTGAMPIVFGVSESELTNRVVMA